VVYGNIRRWPTKNKDGKREERKMAGVLILIGTGATVATAGWWIHRSRQAKEDVSYRVRCAACGQKVRYTADRAGREAMCPRCRAKLTLPETSEIIGVPRPNRQRQLVGKRRIERKTA
jgi:DNA-directed RNA polymerase subunit RPC12/RpoP